uniref:Myosin IXB n=1 Tax=Pavo cristatus TaxID=9049 RepID=A0A8C9FER6_PAVCR
MSLKDADSAVCQTKAAYHLHVYPQLSTESAACCKVTATKDTTSSDVIKDVINILNLDVSKNYVLVEVKETGGEEWVLDTNDSPVHRVLLWPRRAQDEHPQKDGYYFLLQERNTDGTIRYAQMQLLSKETDARRLVERGFLPWQQEDFDDLCNIPNLTEKTLLENLKCRFLKHKIYTYAGSILIAINPFKFLPIYNPKYVKLYENHQLGKLEPHIFAIADVAYHTMLKKHVNQCIVISGESGSGKTQSTNFLIHCLTALSQKGEFFFLRIFSVLSAILYLGNVTYKKKATGRDEGLEVGPPEVLDILSQLLKVRREILVEVLTKRKTVTANDKLILPYSLSEAITARDSMAKSLYSALFDWIVLRINHALLNKKDMEESVTCLSIGVLDIFGFEDFETNSFEQFCINYANEQLQYYFNQHIFKLEQEEYKSEGITWHDIDYTDNVACIHLISKKPTGLFYLLDEESNFPRATNQTLLAKFKQQHEENKFFVATPVMEPAFIIRHFAGKVKYQIKDFREKNMDYMRPDIVALLRSSDSAYVRELIGMDPVAVFRWAVLRAAVQAMAVFAEAGRQRAQKTAELQRSNTPVEKVYRDMHEQIIASIKGLPWQGGDPCKLLRSLSRLQHRSHFMKSRAIKQKQIIPKNLLDSKSLKLIVSMTLHDRTTKSLLHLHKKKKPPSISAQFQTSLNKLLETLGKAEPFFIRCIRSNAEKKEMLFDENLVLQQLRYTGMLETVRIRRSGYSAKYTFQEFIDQFQVLLPKNAKASKEDIFAYLSKLKLDKNNCQIGKTKVFMKEAERQILQDTLHREVIRKIILLQSWLRMVLERRRFLRTRQAAVVLQACWRSRCVRRALQRNNAAIYIQSAWRRYREQKRYLERKKRICLVQAMVRGYLQRKRFQKMVMEKQEAEEEQRKMQEAQDSENDTSKAEGSEPTTDQLPVKHESELDQVVEGKEVPSEQAENLGSSETATLPQKNVTEGSEKVPSSREKREFRRQRGLEHNELQNKHVQFSFEGAALLYPEEQTSSEEALESVPEPRESTEQDAVLQGSNEKEENANDGKAISDTPLLISQSCPERPTDLALNLKNTLFATGSLQTPAECWGEKNKRPVQKETKDLDSPPSSQIQRYVDDPGKLKYKREKWKGKRQSDAGQNDVLSQSLDGRTRQSPDTTEEEKGNKKYLLQKKPSDLLPTSDSVVSLQPASQQIDAKYVLCNGQIHVGYKDLVENYQLLVTNLAKKREEKEVKLVLNLFQSLLDEFIRGYTKKEESEQPKIEEHNGHVFTSYQVSIRQSCEHCSSYIWPMEKACLCSVCKLTCHKKCMSKIQSSCTSCGKKNEQDAEPRHFGVCVSSLTSERNSVPIVMEKLLEHVEMHGLYTEGIYRKSGSANRMKELKQLLQADPNSVKLENYPIHTITGILKQWLRELPDPLMTSAQYSDFLRAVELPEKQEQLCAIYSVLEQLPQANHDTLERLIFHLVKVALIEDVNRMSPNALAIVFAPCLLRCPDTSDPLTSMKDVSKTTMCVEMLIKEQIRKYRIKMDEINQLEAAESIAVRRLSLLRQNTDMGRCLGLSHKFVLQSKSPQVKGNDGGSSELGSLHEEEEVSEADNREKEILIDRIQSIKEEKEDITYRLPELDQRGSDEENVDSETSASTESLLEERTGRMDTEGHAALGAPISLSASLASRRRSSLTLSKIKVPRRTPVMPTANIKLPPGIFKCTESQGKTSANEESQIVVRRREQPAVRTDKVHSIYIAQGSAMAHAQELLDEYEPTAKVKRRFSDPYSHLTCTEK